MKSHFLLFLAFAILFYLSLADNVAVWQGFQHQWERKALDVADTPHRMGSIANYITDEHYTATTGTFHANQTFTPGVNGDYAYPKTYFALIENVNVIRGDLQQVLQDNATTGSHPFAETTLLRTISYSLPASVLPNNIQAVLRGYDIEMNCDPAKQPVGQVCNSNGVWPGNFTIDIRNCSLSSLVYSCDVFFYLSRGCNPACFYGPFFGTYKPFNYVMDYNLTIYYDIIFSAQLNAIDNAIIEATQETSQGNVEGTFISQGSAGYQAALTGMTGFSFNLSAASNLSQDQDLGRYLESLTFFVKDVLYSPSSSQLAFDYSMGFVTALTTWPSNATYSLSTSLLQFTSPQVFQLSNSPATGAVCVNDRFFKCHLNIDGVVLRQTTHDLVNVTFSLPQ